MTDQFSKYLAKLLRLGISEDEKVTFGNEMIDQAGRFTYLGSIISKDGGSSDNVKSRIAKAQGVFDHLITAEAPKGKVSLNFLFFRF